MKMLVFAFVCVAFMLGYSQVSAVCERVVWEDSYKPGNGHEYRLIEDCYSYYDAQRKCLAVQGKLAVQGMRVEFRFNRIHTNLLSGNGSDVYIGLTDLEGGGDFTWNDGVPISRGWTNWAPGEPLIRDVTFYEDLSSLVATCVVVSRDDDGLWSNIPCKRDGTYETYGALCERLIQG